MMSSVDPSHDGPPVAVRAGADLRAARERLGWDLADVAAGLRIRPAYLAALEQGRIDLLPGHAYALGFLRTYAASLGLEPEEIVRRFKAEAGEVTPRTKLAFPAPVPERGLPAGAVILLGLVLAVGAYAGWYRLSGEGRLPAETTAVPERLAPLAEQALPPVARPAAPSSRLAAATPAPEPLPTVAEAAEPPPPAAISPTSAAAAPVNPPLAASQQSQTAAQQPAPAPADPSSASSAAVQPGQPDRQIADTTAAAQQPHVVLRATADAWVQVRDRSGQVLLNRIMHAGDTWPVPDRPNLLLTTGNAGGTELEVNGVSTGLLGASGAVRRDLPLDPAAIRQGAVNPPPGNGIQQAALRAAR